MNYRTEQEVDPQVDPVELVLPPSAINEFGITVKTMRCLEVLFLIWLFFFSSTFSLHCFHVAHSLFFHCTLKIAEVVCHMRDLMTFSEASQLGPISELPFFHFSCVFVFFFPSLVAKNVFVFLVIQGAWCCTHPGSKNLRSKRGPCNRRPKWARCTKWTRWTRWTRGTVSHSAYLPRTRSSALHFQEAEEWETGAATSQAPPTPRQAPLWAGSLGTTQFPAQPPAPVTCLPHPPPTPQLPPSKPTRGPIP